MATAPTGSSSGAFTVTGQSIGDFNALNAMLNAGSVFGARAASMSSKATWWWAIASRRAMSVDYRLMVDPITGHAIFFVDPDGILLS